MGFDIKFKKNKIFMNQKIRTECSLKFFEEDNYTDAEKWVLSFVFKLKKSIIFQKLSLLPSLGETVQHNQLGPLEKKLI
jgi:hypothetical protein